VPAAGARPGTGWGTGAHTTTTLPPDAAPLPQAKQSVDAQHKLAAEKAALIDTVKQLNREVAKLDHFKRSLLQQLQDDDGPGVGGCCWAVLCCCARGRDEGGVECCSSCRTTTGPGWGCDVPCMRVSRDTSYEAAWVMGRTTAALGLARRARATNANLCSPALPRCAPQSLETTGSLAAIDMSTERLLAGVLQSASTRSIGGAGALGGGGSGAGASGSGGGAAPLAGGHLGERDGGTGGVLGAYSTGPTPVASPLKGGRAGAPGGQTAAP